MKVRQQIGDPDGIHRAIRNNVSGSPASFLPVAKDQTLLIDEHSQGRPDPHGALERSLEVLVQQEGGEVGAGEHAKGNHETLNGGLRLRVLFLVGRSV